MLLIVIIFVAVVSLLVFVHELGHFVVARRLGVTVEEFGFGFPPRIVGIKRNATLYSLNWIPFGGFVRLKGETVSEHRDPDSFIAQSRTRRFAILAAGVIMNYLLTIILFGIGFSIGLPVAQRAEAPDSRIRNVRPQIVAVEAGSPAAAAGVGVGDIILSANAQPIHTSRDLKSVEDILGEQDITLALRHGSTEREVMVKPTRTDKEGFRIGVAILDIGTLAYPFPQSVWEGTRATINVTGHIFASFGTLLRDLVVDRKVSQDLSGPVGIVVLTGQAFDLGFPYLLQFVALLSATLAVINFLPLPALDGGRALFVVIEAIRGRSVNHRIESLVHAIGFYLLIALVLLVSLRDVQKFGIGQRLVDTIRNSLNK